MTAGGDETIVYVSMYLHIYCCVLTTDRDSESRNPLRLVAYLSAVARQFTPRSDFDCWRS